MRPELEGHALREVDDAGLAGGVGGVERRGAHSLDRHDVHDAAAPPARDHAGGDRSRTMEDGLQVGPHDGVPALLRYVEERRAERAAHVVDEDVDRPEALDGRGHGAGEGLAVPDVGHERQRLAARGLDLCRRGPCPRLVDLEGGHPCPERREGERDALADARSRPGDERRAVGEERPPGVHGYLGV